MDQLPDRDTLISVPCPTCGQKLLETWGRLATDDYLSCSACGDVINVHREEFAESIRFFSESPTS